MINQHRDIVKETILDSGAYSAFSSGQADINVAFHTKETLKIQKKCPFDYLVQLDKIGNPAVTAINYKYQKKYGFCPVLTTGQDIETIKARGRKVFVGGISGRLKTNREVIDIANLCQKYFKDFHLLGINSQDVIKEIPPCSVDSSSMSYMWIFGKLFLFGHKPKSIEFYRTKKGLDIIFGFCRDYGLSELLDDFKKYNHIENRFPLSFLKLHWFSSILMDRENEIEYKVKNFEALHPANYRLAAAHIWAARFIRDNNSCDTL